MPTVHRNRLDEGAPPYLENNPANPANRQPWDDEALAASAIEPDHVLDHLGQIDRVIG